MAELHKLTNSQVKTASKKGLLPDGGRLFLQVSASRTKSWVLRVTIHSNVREMGLGSYPEVSLSEARERAADARKLAKSGIDPIEKRKAERSAAKIEARSQTTFKECAETFIEAHEASWKNKKHIQQWKNTLASYVYPVFGHRPIKEVDSKAIQDVLKPIWEEKTETATRIRGRLERVLDWARVHGFYTGENPARWKGNLEYILPNPSKLKKVKHHPYLAHEHVAAFMGQLRKQDDIALRAIEFLILTGGRVIEAREARWQEIDLKKKEWTVPAGRMKGGIEHVVALSDACITLLKKLPREDKEPLIFPGRKPRKPFSDMNLLQRSKSIAKNLTDEPMTNHGFRTTFRMWAAEKTSFDHDAIEFCLAHKIKDKVVAAYQRSNLIEKRRVIMNAWADYCANETKDNVVNFHGGSQ